MKEQFEEKLKNKIKALAEVEPSLPVEMGWKDMKKRLERKKRRVVLIAYAYRGAAAIFLIALLYGVYTYLPLSPQQEVSQSNNHEKTRNPFFKNLLSEKKKEEDRLENAEAAPVPKSNTATKSGQTFPEQVHAPTQSSVIAQNSLEKTAKKVFETKRNEFAFSKITPDQRGLRPKLTIPSAQLLAADSSQQNQRMSIAAYLSDVLPEEANAKSASQIGVRVGVALSSLKNFTENQSSSPVNWGGGFSSQLALDRHWSIGSGLLLTQQALALENDTEGANLEDSGPDNNRRLESTDVDLLSLDIPINVQYQFNLPKQQSLRLAVGFSSLLHVRERITENYREKQISFSFNDDSGLFLAEESSILVEEPLSNQRWQQFDFARLLNFSVAYEYPLNSKLFVQLEPYLQYPLGDLTSQGLKFGSGGMRLRLYFGK